MRIIRASTSRVGIDWGEGFGPASARGVPEDLPVADNMVDLDPTIKDAYGLPVARVTYSNHPNDTAVGAYITPL